MSPFGSQLLIGVLFVGACQLDPVNLEDLSCPCASGWVCVNERCIQSAVGPCGRGSIEPGAAQVRDLRVAWATPGQANLRWEFENTSALNRYEVDVAASESDLTTQTNVRTVTGEDNPELARLFLAGASGADPVDRTSVRELEAETGYIFRLVAIDELGNASCTNMVSATTGSLAFGELRIFEDEHPNPANPATLPDCINLVEDASTSYSGSAHYAFPVQCQKETYTDPETGAEFDAGLAVCIAPTETWAACFENVRLRRLAVPARFTETEFETAYLEVAVAIEDSTTAYWAQLGLRTPANAFDSGRHTLVADGAYHVYQVPLSSMGMEYADVMGEIDALRVGSLWRHGATVRIDDAFIKW